MNGSAVEASHEMCSYCFEVLAKTLDGRKHEIATPAISNNEFPLFVTWYKRSGKFSGTYRLRGCIGTFQAGPLHKTLRRYALMSALEDRRFAPISSAELPRLKCGVSLLVNFEKAADAFDWDIGKHGIRIYFEHPAARGKQYTATYLPDVCSEQGWTKRECVESLIRKAGYDGEITPELLEGLVVERYQASKYTLTYDEYVNGDGGDCINGRNTGLA